PPESAMEGPRVRAEPESFWIEGDQLFVIDKAILPDVCLQTGVVDGEMTRSHEVLCWRPGRIYLYLAIGLIVGVGILKLVFAPWILLGGFWVMRFLSRSVVAQVCHGQGVRRRKKALHMGKWGVVIAATAFMVFTSFAPENRLLAGMSMGLLGLYWIGLLDHSYQVKKIKKSVAVLEQVHPEALRQLARWREAHLREA
ncbi:MAG: hypothetical protein ACI8UZ_003057, partial [Akkermansiaceae bacterium]